MRNHWIANDSRKAACPICDARFPYIYRGHGAAFARCPCGRWAFSQHMYGCVETIDGEEIEFRLDWFTPEEEREAHNEAAAERRKLAIAAARQP